MNVAFRTAELSDLPLLVAMLADDFLGSQREDRTSLEEYTAAFEEIEADTNNHIIVAEVDGHIAGMLQLTFTPSLSFRGGTRATVESVRVDTEYRGQKIGEQLMRFAIERAERHGCVSMQLTTHADRTDAQRFYKKLGFTASHVGMKLKL